MKALKVRTSPAKHSHVLLHILGYFRKHLDVSHRRELQRIIEEYRRSLVPLIVPLQALHGLASKYGIRYLMDQYYLNPDPLELELRKYAYGGLSNSVHPHAEADRRPLRGLARFST